MKAKAKHLRIHLTGTLKSCDACLTVKSKAKPINTKTNCTNLELDVFNIYMTLGFIKDGKESTDKN